MYGNLNGNEYGGGDDSNQFAHAYYREELKEKGCNPDIIAQQHGKDENPHKTKHVDANNKFLGKSSHRSYGEDSFHFAHAYYREELKEKGLNPDIIAQQNGKDDNPHKTKHVDANNKFLGKGNHSYSDDNNIGMTKTFDTPFYLDVIGTSHCRSRAIACTKDEYNIFLMWRSAKAKVVSTHQTWIDSLQKQ